MITSIIIALFPAIQYLVTGIIFGAALPIVYLFIIAARWGSNKFRGTQQGNASAVGQVIVLAAGIMLVHLLAAGNNHKARNGVAPVLAAIQQYKTDNHKFPAAITDLVPKYLPRRPMAKYVAVNSGYFIHNGKLAYVDEPTTLTAEFDLETGRESHRTITE